MSCVAAVAGRLVEPDRATARFPASAVPRVAGAIRRLLEQYRPEALVASAARGADLLALTHAHELGIRGRIVLPLDVEEFRRTSVGDDPDWTRRFNDVIADADSRSDLVVLERKPTSRAAYRAVTERILAEARKLAADQSPAAMLLALVVWDGRESGPNDHTAHFKALAERSGFLIEEVRTR